MSSASESIDKVSVAITAVTLLVTLVVGGVVFSEVSAVDGEYVEAAGGYCEEQLGDDAELVQSNVIGDHGGLHCEGENGELIHLHDVPREDIWEAAR